MLNNSFEGHKYSALYDYYRNILKICQAHSNHILLFTGVLLLGCSIFVKSFYVVVNNNILDGFSMVTRPLYQPLDFVNKLVYTVYDISFLYKRDKVLAEKVKVMTALNVENSRLQKENNDLKSLLNYVHKLDGNELKKQEHLLARIFLRSPSIYSMVGVIDVGENNGVSINNAIISDSGLVGVVIEVMPQRSTILLITDIRSYTPVLLLNSGRRAIMRGNGDNRPILEFIKHTVDEDVRELLIDGDIIITSGDGEILPYGVAVGKVVAKEGGYYVDLSANIQSLSYVGVIKK